MSSHYSLTDVNHVLQFYLWSIVPHERRSMFFQLVLTKSALCNRIRRQSWTVLPVIYGQPLQISPKPTPVSVTIPDPFLKSSKYNKRSVHLPPCFHETFIHPRSRLLMIFPTPCSGKSNFKKIIAATHTHTQTEPRHFLINVDVGQVVYQKKKKHPNPTIFRGSWL